MNLRDCALQNKLPSDLRIFDAHAHIGAGKCTNPHLHSMPLEDSLALAKRCGISRIAGMAMSALSGNAAKENLWMIEKCGQYDMLTFYLWYNPRQHEAIMEQIRQYQTHPCFIGVKIHPREDGVSLDTGIYDRLVAYAEEKGILILCHTWDTEPQNRPASFFRVLQNNPKLKLLIGHMGGTYDGCMDSLRLAREYENVYCDINGSLYSQIWIEELVKMAPEHKFIFSTDQTFNDPRSMLGRVLLSQLPDDLKRSILCENMENAIGKRLV